MANDEPRDRAASRFAAPDRSLVRVLKDPRRRPPIDPEVRETTAEERKQERQSQR